MQVDISRDDGKTYEQQGFGSELEMKPPYGLLLIDFVNGFADPAAFGGGNIINAIEQSVLLLAEARQRGWAVAHSRIVFSDDGADCNIFSMKVPSIAKLTEHAADSAIVPQLAPIAGELLVRKTVPSAFFGTSLAAWLTQRGIQTLLVAGATTSGCVRASVVDAMQWGFRPVVVEDCVGDRALAPHHASLFDMKQKYAAVMSRNDVLSALATDINS